MNLEAYAGRWIALVGERVAGVGQTAVQATTLAQRNRPKDRLTIRYVEATGGQPLHLSPLLEKLRPFFLRQNQAIYLVGGAVRDGVLGKPSHDLDFVVARNAIKLANELGDYLGAPAYTLDSERDTGRVVLDKAGTMLDFARFRGADLEADLRDRDFSINAMALPATAVFAESIIDPCNGLGDLEAGQLQLTHASAITDDPIRALRGIRMALTFGLTINPALTTALRSAAPLLSSVSNERIRDELIKLLQSDVPDIAIAQLAKLELLPMVLSSLAEREGSLWEDKAALTHTTRMLHWLVMIEKLLNNATDIPTELKALQKTLRPFGPTLQTYLERPLERDVNGRLLLRLGALFHHCGQQKSERKEVGPKLAADQLRTLAFSNKAVQHVDKLVAHQKRPAKLAATAEHPLSGRTVNRYFRATGNAGLDIGLIALANHLATHNGVADQAVWQPLLDTISDLYEHYMNRYRETVAPPLLVDGHLLMQALAMPRGPEIGRLLRLIEEAQAAGEIQTAEEAIRLASMSRQ